MALGDIPATTVLTGVTRDMAISSEETFGPDRWPHLVDTEAEVVALANDTDAGLLRIFTPTACTVRIVWPRL